MSKVAVNRGVMAAVVVSAIAAAMAACSSSSGGSTSGPCGGHSGGQTNQACDSCTQSKCSSQFNACFGSGGSCSAWVNAGCNGTPDSTCLSCTETMGSCQQSSCATECKLTSGTDSGTDFGTIGDTGTPTTPNCVALASCCNDPSLPAGSKTGCLYVAGANDDATCKTQLDALQGAGYCK